MIARLNLFFLIIFIPLIGSAADDEFPNDFIGRVNVADADTVREWISSNKEFVVLDVRSKREFKRDGKAPESVLHPYAMSKSKKKQHQKFLKAVTAEFDADTTIVVLCSHGMRATHAAWELQEKMGYQSVFVFPGGFEGHYMDNYPAGDGWIAAGLPFEE